MVSIVYLDIPVFVHCHQRQMDDTTNSFVMFRKCLQSVLSLKELVGVSVSKPLSAPAPPAVLTAQPMESTHVEAANPLHQLQLVDPWLYMVSTCVSRENQIVENMFL